jgi:hypothetical protein
MTKEDVHEIYNKLLELTQKQSVQWKYGGFGDYVISFPRSSVGVEYNQNAKAPMFNIYNDDGRIVAYASSTRNDEATDAGIVWVNFDPSELFNLVQEQFYKYSETSANILYELQRLEQSSKNLQIR